MNDGDGKGESRISVNLQQQKQQLQGNITSHRRFWDGGILSNTPLRDLIQSHQDYWTEVENAEKIPDLEVYVVDVWPWMEKGNYPIRPDYDSVVDRMNGLTYQDKTPYDEKVANIVSDYFNLAKELLDLANKKNATKDEINKILDKTGKSKHLSGAKRQYRSLLKDRFEITKLIRIERTGDPDDISRKWCDSSIGTKDLLLRQGVKDALNTLIGDVKESKGIEEASIQFGRFMDTVKNQNDEENRILAEVAQNIIIK